MSLSDLMIAVRQRADMFPIGYNPALINNNLFVTDQELISYINQSYFELYDLLVTKFEKYNMAQPVMFTTDGQNDQFPLPDGSQPSPGPNGSSVTWKNPLTGAVLSTPPKAFYKLNGCDLGLANGNNAWLTIKPFEFIDRNKYIWPQITSTYLGVFNLRFDIVGDNLMFIPLPAGNQQVRLWFTPRMTQLAALVDVVDGISGWTEYIIEDAAAKCLRKEESWEAMQACYAVLGKVPGVAPMSTSIIGRINSASSNRNAGSPKKISDTRTRGNNGYGGPGFNGSFGGY